MIRAVMIAFTVLSLAWQTSVVFAAQGQVLKVVDGDTFMMEVDDVRGPKTIEVNLRCSDAPILTAPFGEASRNYLETLLKKSDSIYFKLQAYCGSENCVEVLAYIPDPLQPEPITYINTRMIAAGMARNNACRGVFSEAEAEAKAGKKGIWSTTKKIVFTETLKTATAGPEAAPDKKSPPAKTTSTAPAIIEVERADRTVTLKSKELSLSKAIAAIDTVSTVPVNLYLIEEQYLRLALDKVPWYTALQYVVEKANLKQVNMNGKIDLYDQLFYYKHIAPYLKLSDNEGVYINVGSGGKEEPVADDGETRYVFVNDFENSATSSRPERESQHGFVQVHDGGGQAPAPNHGRFEVSSVEPTSTSVPAAEPKTVEVTPVGLPPLKPYSGPKAVVEQKPAVAQPQPPLPVAEEEQSAASAEPGSGGENPVIASAADAAVASTTQSNTSTSAAGTQDKVPPEQPIPSAAQGTAAAVADQPAEAVPVLNIKLGRSEAIALVVVFFVVVFGAIFLSRSAAKRAAKAEQSVDASSLVKQGLPSEFEPESQVDAAYENEIFAGLEPSPPDEESEKAVNEIFTPGAEPLAPAVETTPVETGVVAAQPVEPVAQPLASTTENRQPPTDGKEEPGKAAGKPKKKLKGVAADAGNYAVTLDDYERLMKPPMRELRKDCLFEVTSTFDGKSATGIGLDVSRGGMFVDSKENYAVGKVLELEFRLSEDDPQPVRCRCAVTWVNERPDPIKPNYPNGYGVCFLDMDASTRKALDTFLAADPAEVEGEEVDT